MFDTIPKLIRHLKRNIEFLEKLKLKVGDSETAVEEKLKLLQNVSNELKKEIELIHTKYLPKDENFKVLHKYLLGLRSEISSILGSAGRGFDIAHHITESGRFNKELSYFIGLLSAELNNLSNIYQNKDQDFSTLKSITSKKRNILENETSFVFRFMNFREFLGWAINDAIFNDFFITRPMESNLQMTSFKQFRGLTVDGWSKLSEKLTSWEASSVGSKIYSKLEQELIAFFKKYENREQALFEYRKFLINVLFELLVNTYVRGKDLKLLDSIINQIDSSQLTEDKIFFVRDRIKDSPLGDLIGDDIIQLCDEPNYLVNNYFKIKELILNLSKFSYGGAGLDSAEGLISDKATLSYELLVFADKRTLTSGFFTKARELPEWEFFKCKPDKILGVIVIIPSRKLCDDVVKTIKKWSLINPEFAIPVYNSKGILYWPTEYRQ